MRHLGWLSVLSFCAGVIVSIVVLNAAHVSEDTQAIVAVLTLFAIAIYLKEHDNDKTRQS